VAIWILYTIQLDNKPNPHQHQEVLSPSTPLPSMLKYISFKRENSASAKMRRKGSLLLDVSATGRSNHFNNATCIRG
jgi:hypothetical protein